MHRKPVCSKAILALIAAGLVLPIALAVILGLAALLAAMGDAAGGLVLRCVALAGGIGWAIVLICLVLLLAIRALDDADETEK